MLRPLNNSVIILPTSYCSKTGIRSIAEQYLSTSKTYALITKSVDNKYHLVTTHDRSFHHLATVLKIVSYCTIVLPLIAILITSSIKNQKSTNKYYIHDPLPFDNFNMLKSANIHELKALHKFNPNLLTENNPFIKAYLDNNKDLITQLFDCGGEKLLKQTDRDGKTAFMHACYNNNKDMVTHLFGLGGKELLNQTYTNGDTAFIRACKENNKYMVTHLFNLGGKELLNQTDKEGFTPLRHAASNYNTEKLLYLADLGGKEILNQTCKGSTVFELACMWGDKNIITQLFNIGGKDLLQKKNSLGHTPFISACFHHKKNTISYLFELGGPELLNETDEKGDTAFIRACKENNTAVIDCLFQLGGPGLLDQTDRDGNTPFIWACKNEANTKTMKHLFTLGGAKLLDQTDRYGQTAFVCACKNHNNPAMNDLFNLGGKKLLNQTDKDGDTAFIWVCKHMLFDSETIKLLLKLGGKELLDQTDREDNTAFEHICINNESDLPLSFAITHFFKLNTSSHLTRVNRRNNQTALVNIITKTLNRGDTIITIWDRITTINSNTNNLLFETISDSDLLKIKNISRNIYDLIINSYHFQAHRNSSKYHHSSYSHNYSSSSSDYSSSSSDVTDAYVSQATFEDALKVIFDGQKVVKTKKAITKAYKLACAKHHPDKNIGHEKEAHAKFLAIQAAHQQIQNSYSWNSLPQE